MKYLAPSLVGLIAALHVYIMVLEMFLWNRAARVFGIPKAERGNMRYKTMLMNQGIYNGCFAAGLIWGLVHPNPVIGIQVQLFFLGCVAVVGVVGAARGPIRKFRWLD